MFDYAKKNYIWLWQKSIKNKHNIFIKSITCWTSHFCCDTFKLISIDLLISTLSLDQMLFLLIHLLNYLFFYYSNSLFLYYNDFFGSHGHRIIIWWKEIIVLSFVFIHIAYRCIEFESTNYVNRFFFRHKFVWFKQIFESILFYWIRWTFSVRHKTYGILHWWFVKFFLRARWNAVATHDYWPWN